MAFIMKANSNSIKSRNWVFRLFEHISQHRRYQFAALFVLTLLSSIAEIASLGAIVPFIGILTQPEKVFHAPLLAELISNFGFTSPQALVLPLTLIFMSAAVIAGILRILLLVMSVRLANAIGADLSTEVYRRALFQPYKIHISRSSNEIISSITQKVGIVTTALNSLVAVLTSAVLFVAIVVTLIVINPVVAAIALGGFGFSYALIAWVVRRRLSENSEAISKQQTQVVKSLREGLGAIRDVLLDGTQAVYCAVYQKSMRRLQGAIGENQYITLAPRYVMEALGMILIGLFAYFMSQQPGGIAAGMPVLGALALGGQRLLPLLQQLYGNWSFVAGSRASISDVIDLLEQPLPEEAYQSRLEALSFNHSIVFDHLSFRYSDESPWVLNDFNLIINKGARIGFVGTTGSGKSTALDLLMALLDPTQGTILVDGQSIYGKARRAWQAAIAHVPQSIYLSDASIAENIAFGVPVNQIDFERVRKAATQAQLAEFIETKPEAYNTIVGERGVRLSGGQRQRIGVARALYKQASVLILDEATSALDNETESALMNVIEGLDQQLTLLIVAHRLTTLRSCDQIVELGKSNKQGVTA